MKLYEDRNKSASHVYFHTPSEEARAYLLYPVVAGAFVRRSDYCISRDRYDSFLVACVSEGELCLWQDGVLYRAVPGEVLLVDCYRPHEYFTDSYAVFQWLHFDGLPARPWVDTLISRQGRKFSAGSRCAGILQSVRLGIKQGESEYLLSQKIHSLLTELSTAGGNPVPEVHRRAVEEAKIYMEARLEEDLTVAQIADAVHFSPSYFTKIFKDTLNLSPYEYLLSRRVERAKGLLLQTDLPLDVIATRSGFHSCPNFICAFRRSEGLTPHKFRRQRF